MQGPSHRNLNSFQSIQEYVLDCFREAATLFPGDWASIGSFVASEQNFRGRAMWKGKDPVALCMDIFYQYIRSEHSGLPIISTLQHDARQGQVLLVKVVKMGIPLLVRCHSAQLLVPKEDTNVQSIQISHYVQICVGILSTMNGISTLSTNKITIHVTGS